jgi:rubrerythrin
MDTSPPPPPPEGKAYEAMLRRVVHAMDQAGDQARPRLENALARARALAVELGELTREEAERISDYLARDVEDAARHLAAQETDLAGWFHMDVQLLEHWLLDTFGSLADHTKLELAALDRSLERTARWHTGELTSPGVLACEHCGKRVHFTRSDRLPPCPACNASVFVRLTRKGDDGG